MTSSCNPRIGDHCYRVYKFVELPYNLNNLENEDFKKIIYIKINTLISMKLMIKDSSYAKTLDKMIDNIIIRYFLPINKIMNLIDKNIIKTYEDYIENRKTFLKYHYNKIPKEKNTIIDTMKQQTKYLLDEYKKEINIFKNYDFHKDYNDSIQLYLNSLNYKLMHLIMIKNF